MIIHDMLWGSCQIFINFIE
uniref:Uncharacterized protein n=1 Tax=Rhizophora mucronata TaxID=61149 RepID=A0A2P2NKT2_RHIMU